MARLWAEAGESWQENYKTLTNCLQGGEVLLSGVTGSQLALKHWWHDENGTRWHFDTAPFEDREVWHSVMNLPVTPANCSPFVTLFPQGQLITGHLLTRKWLRPVLVLEKRNLAVDPFTASL